MRRIFISTDDFASAVLENREPCPGEIGAKCLVGQIGLSPSMSFHVLLARIINFIAN